MHSEQFVSFHPPCLTLSSTKPPDILIILPPEEHRLIWAEDLDREYKAMLSKAGDNIFVHLKCYKYMKMLTENYIKCCCEDLGNDK